MSESAQAPVPFRRVVGASLIGTSIEWYDFFLYGSAVTIVFDRVFFPESDRTVAILLGFLTYALGFLARPLGGLVFGHYGDRLGRKKLLIISLVMMGGATFLMGLLPTYAAIGVAAPLLLTLLRLVQGFAVGGEWGGAVLLVSEHGGPERRGFWASIPQAGVPIGNLLATAVLAVLAAVQSDAAFIGWGWRIPFLLSAVLVVIGLWMRLAVSETPAFQEAAARAAARGQELRERAPILTVLKVQWRAVLTAVGARFAENVVYYVITTFVLVYVVTAAGADKTVGLNAIVIASFVHLIAIPAWGALSDRVGRRPVYLLGAIGTGLWTFAFFPLVETGTLGPTTLAVSVGLIFHGAMYGPQAAYFSELFATRVRYSGASIGYQAASIVAGALAPLIATALYDRFGSSVPISVYVLMTAIVTVVAVAVSQETRARDLRSYDSADEPVTEGAR